MARQLNEARLRDRKVDLSESPTSFKANIVDSLPDRLILCTLSTVANTQHAFL